MSLKIPIHSDCIRKIFYDLLLSSEKFKSAISHMAAPCSRFKPGQTAVITEDPDLVQLSLV